MADQQISVVFTADASPMTAELRSAVNELKKLELALRKTTDISEINKLTVDIGLLKDKITSLGGVVQSAGSKLGTNLKSGANNAAFAVNDLNRVVQDLPYGFIGISNNINPLVESFTRLKASAKESGVTLGSELLGALKGPGGLALGIAAVTTAITFAEIGFSRWINSSKDVSSELGHLKQVISELSVETKKSKIDFDNYMDSLDRVKEIGTLDIRLNITGLGAADDYKRKLAELQLQKDTLYEKIAGGLFVLGPGVGEGAMLTLQKEEEKLNQLYNTVISTKPARVTNALFGEGNEAFLKFEKIINSFGGLENAYLATEDQLSSLDDEQKVAVQAYGAQQKVVQDASKTLQNYRNQLALTGKQIDVTKQIEKDRIAQLQSEKPTIDKLIAKLREDLKDQINIGTSFNESTLSEQIKLIDTAIRKLISDFNVPTSDSRIINLQIELDALKEKKFLEDINNSFNKAQYDINQIYLSPNYDDTSIKEQIKLVDSAIDKMKSLELQYGMLAPTSFFDSLNKQLEAFKQSLAETKEIPVVDISLPDTQNQLKEFKDYLVKFRVDLAEQIGALIGEGLYSVISGQTDGLASAFQGLFRLFGNAVIQLGEYAIMYSDAIIKLKESIIAAAGPSGILVGIGLIALGTLINAAASGIGKAGAFAVGTNYAPGGMALVGERGPEMVSLPRGAKVTPAAQTAQMMGGAMQQVEVFGVLRGQDIYFSNKKYSQTYRRTT